MVLIPFDVKELPIKTEVPNASVNDVPMTTESVVAELDFPMTTELIPEAVDEFPIEIADVFEAVEESPIARELVPDAVAAFPKACEPTALATLPSPNSSELAPAPGAVICPEDEIFTVGLSNKSVPVTPFHVAIARSVLLPGPSTVEGSGAS